MEVFNLINSRVKNIRGKTVRKILSANPKLFEELESPKLLRGFACEMAIKIPTEMERYVKAFVSSSSNSPHLLDFKWET